MGKRSRESTNKSIDVVVMPGLPIVKLFTRAGGEAGGGKLWYPVAWERVKPKGKRADGWLASQSKASDERAGGRNVANGYDSKRGDPQQRTVRPSSG